MYTFFTQEDTPTCMIAGIIIKPPDKHSLPLITAASYEQLYHTNPLNLFSSIVSYTLASSYMGKNDCNPYFCSVFNIQAPSLVLIGPRWY